jgi:hypothetical protein
MQIKSIKAGRWYETELGVGECTRAGGTHPPTVQVRITHPFPRGTVYMKPRQVKREVPAPAEVKS